MVYIALIAFILRFYQLGNTPPGLYLDEIFYGLDAYSLIKTGKDIYGHIFPLAFQSSGYYPPLFSYILAPFFLFFPLSAWTVRLPAAISGTLTVLFTYLLTKKLIGARTALISSFLLAILPWHVHLSRVAFLASFSFIFVLAGAWLFFTGNIILSTILFALSTFGHYGYKLFSPVLFLLLFKAQRLSIRKNLFPLTAVWVVAIIVNLYSKVTFNAFYRVDQLASFQPIVILQQYFQAFFVFKSLVEPILFPWTKTLLPLSFIPVLLLGIYQLRFLSRRTVLIITGWLLLSPLPAALAGMGNHPVRNTPMLIPLAIISALGISRLKRWLIIILIFFTLESSTYLYPYFLKSNQFFSPVWGQPERQLVQQRLPEYHDTYNVLLAYYAFEFKTPPHLLQQALLHPTTYNNLPAKKLDQTFFISQEEIN